jgi:metallo-beta-lactamase class B
MTLILALLVAETTFANSGKPVKPERIIGNLYYVGANEITAFLFATPKGLILLDGGFQEMAPQVEKNIQQLGFKLSDVKIILNSQAHYDHAAALPKLLEDTGAKMYATERGARDLGKGGADNVQTKFEPVKTDVIIKDKVELGGFELHVVETPGHTPGCTSYAARIDGKDVVFVCSMSVVSKLSPQEVKEYRESFAKLRALPCDIFLASHGSMFHLTSKLAAPASFVNPADYRSYLDEAERDFERQVPIAVEKR